MAYTPPTPTLPEGEELDKILNAFDSLPPGKLEWFGHDADVALCTAGGGKQAILNSSAEGKLLFRMGGERGPYMEDAAEIRQGQSQYAAPFGGLDNPAAIALASAWMVPLLVEKLGVLQMLHAGCELDAMVATRLLMEASTAKGELLGTLLALTTLSPEDVTPEWKQKIAERYRQMGGTHV